MAFSRGTGRGLRGLGGALLGRLALLLTAMPACDDGGGGGNDDAAGLGGMQGDANVTGGAGGGPASDAGADATAPDTGLPGPSAPVIEQPAAGASVFFSIPLTIAAEANASLQIRLTSNGKSIGGTRTTVPANGRFSSPVDYRGAIHGDSIEIEAILRNARGMSSSKVVVTHGAPHTINVALSQSSGPTTGETVFVRLFTVSGDPGLPLWVDEQKVSVPAGPLPPRQVSFRVPPGSFVLRAFRDNGGPAGQGPDGQPTLGPDAQSRGIAVTVPANPPIVVAAAVPLVATAGVADRYAAFNGYTFHQSPLPAPPSVKQGNQRVIGPGQCGGFFLRFSAQRIGSAANLSAPMLRLPDLRVVKLSDDGGCGPAKHDNSTSSYDDEPGDGGFGYGIADPAESQTGTYVFAFRAVTEDFIQVETDEITQIKKLPLLRELVSPDNANTLSTRTPTLSWRAVPGAAQYEVVLGSPGSAYSNSTDPNRVTTQPMYQPQTPLVDDRCYVAFITAFDAPPFTGDTDAVAWSEMNAFCVDTDQQNSMVLTGKITNNTQQNVPVVVRAQSEKDGTGGGGAVVRVPAGANTYRIAMLRGTTNEGGKVDAFLDRALSGHDSSLENSGFESHFEKGDFSKNAIADLTFNPRLITTSPIWFDKVSARPTFTWENYAVSAGALKPAAPFSYVLWMDSESNGFQPTVFLLPSSATALDLANPPTAAQGFDIVPYVTCMESGGAFSTDATGGAICTGGVSARSNTTLVKNVLYVWAMSIIECDFSTLKHPAKTFPDPNADPYLTCVGDILTSNKTFASSAILPFSMMD